MNEMLLCRRFEIARASNLPLDSMDPVIVEHVLRCRTCQELQKIDTRIAATLSANVSNFPAAARERLILGVRSDLNNRFPTPKTSSWLPVAVVLFVAIGVIISGRMVETEQHTNSIGSVSVAPYLSASNLPGIESQNIPFDAVSALDSMNQDKAMSVAALVAVHRTGNSKNLPHGGIRAIPLPASFAGFGVQHALSPAGPLSVADATLFVLSPKHLELPTGVLEVLADGRLAHVQHGLHTASISERNDHIYVLVTTPGGVEDIAAR